MAEPWAATYRDVRDIMSEYRKEAGKLLDATGLKRAHSHATAMDAFLNMFLFPWSFYAQDRYQTVPMDDDLDPLKLGFLCRNARKLLAEFSLPVPTAHDRREACMSDIMRSPLNLGDTVASLREQDPRGDCSTKDEEKFNAWACGLGEHEGVRYSEAPSLVEGIKYPFPWEEWPILESASSVFLLASQAAEKLALMASGDDYRAAHRLAGVAMRLGDALARIRFIPEDQSLVNLRRKLHDKFKTMSVPQIERANETRVKALEAYDRLRQERPNSKVGRVQKRAADEVGISDRQLRTYLKKRRETSGSP